MDQLEEGVRLDHLGWYGNYVAEKKPDVVLCIGDFGDFPSLSQFGRGTRDYAQHRYCMDIAAFHEGMQLFLGPIEAARKHLEGWVDLEFTVKADGSVRDTLIRNAQPAGVFDQAAAKAVQQWRFRPVTRDGKPVEQRARIRVRFSLND